MISRPGLPPTTLARPAALADGLHIFVRLSIRVEMLFDCVSSVREFMCTFYLFALYSQEKSQSHRCHKVKGKTHKLHPIAVTLPPPEARLG